MTSSTPGEKTYIFLGHPDSCDGRKPFAATPTQVLDVVNGVATSPLTFALLGFYDGASDPSTGPRGAFFSAQRVAHHSESDDRLSAPPPSTHTRRPPILQLFNRHSTSTETSRRAIRHRAASHDLHRRHQQHNDPRAQSEWADRKLATALRAEIDGRRQQRKPLACIGSEYLRNGSEFLDRRVSTTRLALSSHPV